MKFDVRFYLVAILFIIFRFRNCIFVSMGSCFRSYRTEGYLAMAIFILILLVGFIYEWKKGAGMGLENIQRDGLFLRFRESV